MLSINDLDAVVVRLLWQSIKWYVFCFEDLFKNKLCFPKQHYENIVSSKPDINR